MAAAKDRPNGPERSALPWVVVRGWDASESDGAC